MPSSPAGFNGAAALPRQAINPAAADRARPNQRYQNFMRWVRKTHGWLGLWGAILGLLFGFSGIWLNHRAVLKLPTAQQRVNGQIALPEPPPASAEEMAVWLQATLNQSGPANTIRVEPAKPVAWTEKTRRPPPAEAEATVATKDGTAAAMPPVKVQPLMQPERWVVNFGGPNMMVQADYWRGNRSVGITTTANGFIATLTNLHKGNGMPVPWILLIDTLAGSMIFLSVSGVILWVQTNRRRVVGAAIFGLSVVLTLGLALMRM